MSSNNDTYWLTICNAIASKSKCLSRKIGCVIVKDSKFIVSTGYNGPATGCKHCDDKEYRKWLFSNYAKKLNDYQGNLVTCPRKIIGFDSGEGLEYCQAAHAERNAISIAAKLGHSTDGCTLYLNDAIPCFECVKSLANAGIKEIVITELKDYDKQGITGKYLLDQAGVKVRRYDL